MSSGLVGVAGRGPVTGLALGLELGLGGGPGGIAFAHPVPLLAAGRSGGGVEAQVGPAGAPEQLGPRTERGLPVEDDRIVPHSDGDRVTG